MDKKAQKEKKTAAVRKEASLELWRELYDVALNLKTLQPWNYLWDRELVCIQIPGREETLFCSVMGRAGDCCALAVYEGWSGLRDFSLVARAQEWNLPFEYVMYEQSNITGYFGDRQEVPDQQKQIIRELGLKFRGKNNWLYFVSFKSRYVPYIPDEREVKTLIDAYKGLYMAVRAVMEQKITICWKEGEFLWRIYNEAAEEWNMFAAPMPEGYMNYPELILDDAPLKAELKKIPASRARILLDFFYLNAEVEDGISGRPQNPLVFVAMDETSKMILDLSVLEAHQREVDAAVGFFIRFLKQNGKMRYIKARNPWIFSALTELCEDCGVELIRDPLKPMDIALEDFREHMSLF